MINNKTMSYCIAIVLLSSNLIAHAKNTSVSYRCPTIEEANSIQDIRTSINDKDVHWEIKNTNPIRNDKPIEFKKAVLKNKDNNSYDMLVTCIYRTKENQKLIFSPLPSFNWYVDAVAEKALGTGWYKLANGNLECTKSILNCGFIFR